MNPWWWYMLVMGAIFLVVHTYLFRTCSKRIAEERRKRDEGEEEIMSMEGAHSRYLLVVWGDVQPDMMGPFPTDKERDKVARRVRREEGDDHGIYVLNIKGQISRDDIRVEAYSGRFFEEEI